jgi:hypothetical protein
MISAIKSRGAIIILALRTFLSGTNSLLVLYFCQISSASLVCPLSDPTLRTVYKHDSAKEYSTILPKKKITTMKLVPISPKNKFGIITEVK